MNLIKYIIILYIILITFWTLEFEAFASSSFWVNDLNFQLTPESKWDKVKKLQNIFTHFWIYNWNIDWNYKSIEKSLIDYQINSWLFTNPWDWWVWHYWKKTKNQLLLDFGNKLNLDESNYKLQDNFNTQEKYFIVTAYYSPIPGQKKYLKWSYEADIRLNWWWKITASWTWVFPWLLAWPRNYLFWTKIKLDWIWIWSIQDRWWAIVNAWVRWHEHDRIDVWMWYWDDWLQRALNWWKRKVKWQIIPNNSIVSVEFDISPISEYNKLTVNAEKPKKENVIKLQNLMTDIWLYNWKIDWKYNNIKNTLIKFQVDNNIIKSKKSYEAWYFWEKTLAVLRKKYWWWIFKVPKNIVYLSLQKKQKLQLTKSKLLNYIQKKSKWNKQIENKYKLLLKNNIEIYIKKISSKEKQEELKYLKNIL